MRCHAASLEVFASRAAIPVVTHWLHGPSASFCRPWSTCSQPHRTIGGQNYCCCSPPQANTLASDHTERARSQKLTAGRGRQYVPGITRKTMWSSDHDHHTLGRRGADFFRGRRRMTLVPAMMMSSRRASSRARQCTEQCTQHTAKHEEVKNRELVQIWKDFLHEIHDPGDR